MKGGFTVKHHTSQNSHYPTVRHDYGTPAVNHPGLMLYISLRYCMHEVPLHMPSYVLGEVGGFLIPGCLSRFRRDPPVWSSSFWWTEMRQNHTCPTVFHSSGRA